MPTYVVDIETDGLISTKIHVMSVGYQDDNDEWQVKSTDDPEIMKDIMSDPDNTIVGHNFKMFDAVELERVLGFKVKARIIDTLALAWYIFPQRRKSYGLAAFGDDYGVEKPKIDDWENLSYEEYSHRCESDVKINIPLWEDIKERLFELYGDWEEVDSLIKYLMFKMDCLVHQQSILTKVDVDRVRANIDILTPLKDVKEAALIQAMPPGRLLKSKPKKMYKADGTISALGQKWFDYLKENNKPIDTEEVYDVANPSSVGQLKDWLFTQGWEPRIFNEGANGPVPQVRDSNRQLCPSVLDLAEKEPAIMHLDGLTVINHRLGILNSFLDSVDDEGYCVAGAAGFTNTLRLRHTKPIVNLPGVTGDIHDAMDEGATKEEAVAENLRDGQIIRECIVAPEGYIVCGSDIASLEDNTKRHFMYNYDPEYVVEQMEEGFDPHLDLAVRAGAITEEQAQAHKDGTESHKAVRDLYKMANYSCIYGVGVAKLAKTTGLSKHEATALRDSYWERNWSIKQLPKDIEVKTIGDQMWLLNPVSRYWYSLRGEQDIFSTLNQGTGAFVFDVWLKFMMAEGVIPFLQYHDEMVTIVKPEIKDRVKDIITGSMQEVNNLLQLNVEIEVDVQFGNNYADVH